MTEHRGRPLKVGVQLPEVEWEPTWPELAGMARAAERVGLDSIWVGDHLLYKKEGYPPLGPWEAWSTLAALAAITERVELGPLVAASGFHNPSMLAKKAATIDLISGGRFVLGLGSGWNPVEYEAYGFPYDRRVSRFAEAFEIIRALLREGEIDFAGEFYSAKENVLLPRGPRPGGAAHASIPLMVGSSGERMLAITLPHVEMWNMWYDDYENSPEGLAPALATLDVACEKAGRDPKTLVRTICPYVKLPGGKGRSAGDPLKSRVRPIPVDRLAEELRTYAGMGIGHVMLVMDPITEASIEALAPVLAELDG